MKMISRIVGLVALCAAGAMTVAAPQQRIPAAAQAPEVTFTPGVQWVGSRGVTETVAQIMAREASLTPAERAEAEKPVMKPFRPTPVSLQICLTNTKSEV